MWVGLVILAAIGLSFAMERVLPYEDAWNEAHGDTAKDIAHGIVYEAANLFTLVVFLIISAMLLPEWSLWPRELPIVVQFLLAVVIVDCTMTVVHYFSHRVDWLWRLHAVHHGVHRLYGFNGFIRHPLHQALDIASGTLPLILLGLPVDVAVLLGAAIAIQLIVQHSNVDYALGPFQRILAIGPVHRLHHVNWAGEGDVNFGLFFTVWDRLLGTFQLPHAASRPSATSASKTVRITRKTTGRSSRRRSTRTGSARRCQPTTRFLTRASRRTDQLA